MWSFEDLYGILAGVLEVFRGGWNVGVQCHNAPYNFFLSIYAIPALSAMNKILFEHLISNNSVDYNSICGMVCGRKKTPQARF